MSIHVSLGERRVHALCERRVHALWYEGAKGLLVRIMSSRA